MCIQYGVSTLGAAYDTKHTKPYKLIMHGSRLRAWLIHPSRRGTSADSPKLRYNLALAQRRQCTLPNPACRATKPYQANQEGESCINLH